VNAILVLPTKVKRWNIKQGYLDKKAGFIKLDGLLSVTPYCLLTFVGKITALYEIFANNILPNAYHYLTARST
jgi:hypothetical protein